MKKRLTIIAIIFGGILNLVLLAYVLQPVWAWCFLSPERHYGVENYSNGSYLEYDDGKEFESFLVTYLIPEQCTPTGFYYIDNHHKDNLFRGKGADGYVLEVVYSMETYTKAKQRISNSTMSKTVMEDYDCYILTTGPYEEETVLFIGFCEEKLLARYCMITDYTGENEGQLSDLRFLNWNATGELYRGQGQGDGSPVS